MMGKAFAVNTPNTIYVEIFMVINSHVSNINS